VSLCVVSAPFPIHTHFAILEDISLKRDDESLEKENTEDYRNRIYSLWILTA
jgi:hypothetical protein